MYVSLVMDAWSCKIVGYLVHGNLQAEEVSQALKDGATRTAQWSGIDSHSDRGIRPVMFDLLPRYPSPIWLGVLNDGWIRLLSECIGGASQRHPQREFSLNRPADLERTAKMVAQSVPIYNQERPHVALKYKTPGAAHRASVLQQTCQPILGLDIDQYCQLHFK